MKLKKTLCLLLSAALVLSIGLPCALAAGTADDEPVADTYGASFPAACEECGETEGHAETCSQYAAPAAACEECGETEGHAETCSHYAAPVMVDESACTCGEDAPENLAQHEETCPRKQYILGLIQNDEGSYRTARQIYADWDSYDAATRTDILSMVAAYVETEYDTLRELIGAGEESGAGLTVDGVTVAGLPEGVTLTVRSVAPRDMSRKSLELLGRHRLVFSLDITPQDDVGAWQPGTGETVTVSLDAAQFGLTDGDRIAILHEHDGDTGELGTFTVADGKLTFETDGFSNFYGYTVDFEYNDTWYSIGGGGEVYLFELFAMLGISRSDSEVASVTVSNSSLLSAEKVVFDGYTGETAWLIHSLRPFDTAETMEIAFYDGNSITVNVYDANYTALPAGSYTFYDGDTIGAISVPENAVVNITLAGTVTVNGTLSIGKNAQVTITGSGIFQRGSSFGEKMFYVADGGSLTIHGTSESNIIIDGSASFTVTDVPNSTRKSLTFQRGVQAPSAAVFVNSAGTVELEYVTMRNLYSTSEGAAIFTAGDTTDTVHSTVTLTNVTVQNCATTSSQSILLFNDCAATLTDCEILDNHSGGMYAGTIKAGGPEQFSLLTMKNCTASRNYSSGWGGVVLWAANNSCGSLKSRAIIDGCILTDNTARWLGGALSNEAIMEVKNTTIQDNIAMAGGGIATFPFTLTESVEAGDNACGLTLGEGNNICGNTAYAAETFTPYKKNDTGSVDGDDMGLIANPTTYIGGGGGVWCYMNKARWTCSLEIGKNNTISENKANNVGGGVYIDKVAGETTTLSITGATISGNTAVNGGGVAVKDADVRVSSGQIQGNKATGNGGGIYVAGGSATVSGDGSVIRNEASNGGGLYIYDGKLDVQGGIVSHNVATGSYTGNTTQADNTAGVGGGAFIRSGEFSITGTHIGIYSNKAVTAANDVYARGEDTTVTLPKVTDMDLSGVDAGEARPTGWFADYQSSDTMYPQAVIGKENNGRYVASTEGNVEIAHDTLTQNKGTFYCLTLGVPHPGYGTLTIKKSGIDTRDHDGTTEVQSSLFLVEGTTKGGERISLYVTVAGNGSVTIQHLMDGEYTVREITDWTWRYDRESQSYHPVGSISTAEKVTISAVNPDWDAEFENERERPYWLSGDNCCRNLWSDGGMVTRSSKRRKTE